MLLSKERNGPRAVRPRDYADARQDPFALSGFPAGFPSIPAGTHFTARWASGQSASSALAASNPLAPATIAASVRVATPSFRRMAETWTLAVFALMNRRSPI